MAGVRVVVEVPAPASQVRLAVERLDAARLPLVDRVLVALAGRFTCSVEAVSHTRTVLALDGRTWTRAFLQRLAARTGRRAVHYTRFGVRTGASTTPVAAARRRR